MQTTEEIQKLFLDGFEQVVVPHIQSIEGDVGEIRQDVGEIRTQLSRMEPKLDDTIARVDGHSVRLEQLEKAKE